MGAEVDKGLGALVLMTGVIRFVQVYERKKNGFVTRLTWTFLFLSSVSLLLVVVFPLRKCLVTNFALLLFILH